MFIFSKTFLSDIASLLAGIIYVYAPYHAVQIYVRGAVGRILGLCRVAVGFYAMWKRKLF